MHGHTAGKRQDKIWNWGFSASKAQVLNTYTLVLPRRSTLGYQLCYLIAMQPQASSLISLGQQCGWLDSRVLPVLTPCAHPLSESQPRLSQMALLRLCFWEFPCPLLLYGPAPPYYLETHWHPLPYSLCKTFIVMSSCRLPWIGKEVRGLFLGTSSVLALGRRGQAI